MLCLNSTSKRSCLVLHFKEECPSSIQLNIDTKPHYSDDEKL